MTPTPEQLAMARATKVEDRLVEDAEDALDGMIARQRLAGLKAGTDKVVSGAELEARLGGPNFNVRK